MQVVVATHGHCLDGLASAVVFSRLIRKTEGEATTFTYRGCGYGDGQLVPSEAVLSGDQNVILDYRFYPIERLTWYFDHHRTAFVKPEDRALYESRVPTGRYHFDAECPSCTKLVAEVAQQRFGVDTSDLADLVHWANVMDSAAFDGPEQALDRTNPVLRLAAVVERHGDDGFLHAIVPELETKPLLDVARSEIVERRYAKLGAQHERFVQMVKERATRRGRVVFVDLTDEPTETIGKFVTYALYPDAVYSVIIGQTRRGVKISVGYNPWCGTPRDADISAICARYGGGGHPVVGAVAFEKKDVERAREVARSISTELGG